MVCRYYSYDPAKNEEMEDFEIGVYDSELYYSGKLNEWVEFRRKQIRILPKRSCKQVSIC